MLVTFSKAICDIFAGYSSLSGAEKLGENSSVEDCLMGREMIFNLTRQLDLRNGAVMLEEVSRILEDVSQGQVDRVHLLHLIQMLSTLRLKMKQFMSKQIGSH